MLITNHKFNVVWRNTGAAKNWKGKAYQANRKAKKYFYMADLAKYFKAYESLKMKEIDGLQSWIGIRGYSGFEKKFLWLLISVKSQNKFRDF